MVFKVACFEIFGFLIFIKLGNRATVCWIGKVFYHRDACYLSVVVSISNKAKTYQFIMVLNTSSCLVYTGA